MPEPVDNTIIMNVLLLRWKNPMLMVEEGERINYNRHFIEQDNGLCFVRREPEKSMQRGNQHLKPLNTSKDKTAPSPFSLTNKERKQIIITLYSKYILL
jgi:hypothetical protein